MENKNNANEQQTESEEMKEVEANYNKIIAVADKITEDYNDDPDMLPIHVLLGIGVFLRRMEYSSEDGNAVCKDGKPWGKQNVDSPHMSTYADMLDAIKTGYNIEKIREAQIPEESKQ